MSLYLRVRAARAVALVAAGVVLLLAWPGASMGATPSPTGATVMAGVFLAVAVPAVVGWGCGRGDGRLESTGVRGVVLADLAFAVAACGTVAALGATLHAIGLADAGLAAARATLVYLGLALLAVPFWGWRLAPVLPALFLLVVAVFGRGEDTEHPAPWAFIAARADEPMSWLLTIVILVVGVAAYLQVPHRLRSDGSTE